MRIRSPTYALSHSRWASAWVMGSNSMLLVLTNLLSCLQASLARLSVAKSNAVAAAQGDLIA
jgi:hypothetical protein